MRGLLTSKMNLQRRLDALNQDPSVWIKHYQEVVAKCNNTVHSTMQIKPHEAKLHKKHLRVAWRLQNASKKNRK